MRPPVKQPPRLAMGERGKLFNASQVRSLILEEVADWGSQRAVAKRMGVSDAYLSDVLRCRREAGPKIAEYFELEAVTLYRARSQNTPDSQRGDG